MARLRGESLQLPEHFRIIRQLIPDRNHPSHLPIPTIAQQLPDPENPNNMDSLEDSSSDPDSSIGSFNDFALRSSSPVQSSAPIKYKPKFSRSELLSNQMKYAEVFIVRAVQPRAIYITIDDDDLPRYHQLHRDLQLEFQSANRQSPSYCPSPRIGNNNLFILKRSSSHWVLTLSSFIELQVILMLIESALNITEYWSKSRRIVPRFSAWTWATASISTPQWCFTNFPTGKVFHISVRCYSIKPLYFYT